MLALMALSMALQKAPDAKAEGFGAGARGGDGGRVITVTTLEDGGAGSLRSALSLTCARVIHFAVEGTIDLKSRIRVTAGRVTIDGSTAPGKGVTIARNGLSFVGDCDDIIVRHLRLRVTEGGNQGDGLLFWGKDGGVVERALVDHCSITGATDEGINTWGEARDITVQWSIIAEGPNRADHPKGIHNYGWLSGPGSDRITIHHCLFANNIDRSPKLQSGVYDMVNNVVYNWSGNNATKLGAGARANVVGNFYAAGPRSSARAGCVFVEDEKTQVFVAGNASALTPRGTEDQDRIVTPTDGRARAGFVAKKRFEAPAVATQTAEEAKALVFRHAGARVRDAEDERIIDAARGK